MKPQGKEKLNLEKVSTEQSAYKDLELPSHHSLDDRDVIRQENEEVFVDRTSIGQNKNSIKDFGLTNHNNLDEKSVIRQEKEDVLIGKASVWQNKNSTKDF